MEEGKSFFNKEIYGNLIAKIKDIIEKVSSTNFVHENSIELQKKFLAELKFHRDKFTQEVRELKKASEWDKYTIAFFGETNAGKSTIIEALRILGNEKEKIQEYREVELLSFDLNEAEKKEIFIKEKLETLLSEIKLRQEEILKKEGKCKQISEKINDVKDQKELNKEKQEEVLSQLEILSDLSLQYSRENKKIVRELAQQVALLDEEALRIENYINSFFYRTKKMIFRWFSYHASVNKKRLYGLEDKVEALRILKAENDSRLKSENSKLHITRVQQQLLNNELEKLNREEKDLEHQFKILNQNVIQLNSGSTEIEENISKYSLQLESCTKRKEGITKKLESKGDGKIIGTGKQDFTVDVKEYEFELNGMPLVLIDVPGIEGNESRYIPLIKKAISKAHAVFYVNGSNKKAEEATLLKIKSYLRDQTEVFSISNIKGKPDTYEFEEDRIGLEKTHRNSKENAELIKHSLKSILEEKYSSHYNIQGLVAFTALSKFINYKRRDLIRSQKGFQKYFGSRERMKSFSNIEAIQNLIAEQQPTFKDKIRNANLQKVIGITEGFLKDLYNYQEMFFSDTVISEIETEINKYLNEINNEQRNLKRTHVNIVRNTTNGSLQKFREFLHFVIDGEDEDSLNMFSQNSRNKARRLLKDFRLNKKKETLERFISLYVSELYAKINLEFSTKMTNEQKRFLESIETKRKRIKSRLGKLQNIQNQSGIKSRTFDTDPLIDQFDLKQFAGDAIGVLASVGGMALLGGKIGTFFGPGIGNLVGVIAGGVVGLVLFVIKKLLGGESREAKLKRETEKSINVLRKGIVNELNRIADLNFKTLEDHLKSEKEQILRGNDDLRNLQALLQEKIFETDQYVQYIKNQKIKSEYEFN